MLKEKSITFNNALTWKRFLCNTSDSTKSVGYQSKGIRSLKMSEELMYDYSGSHLEFPKLEERMTSKQMMMGS
jgi:hypothetical protein